MLGNGLDICPFTASIAQGTPDDVDHLLDVSVFDDDARPYRGENRTPGDKCAAVSNEMNECPERFFGNVDAFPLVAPLERVLADIELEFAELVDLGRSATADNGRKKE